jgi:hypothetical protein
LLKHGSVPDERRDDHRDFAQLTIFFARSLKSNPQWHISCSLLSNTITRGEFMSLDLMKEKGIALEKQKFDWKDIVRVPTSKLDDDAFTRVRIILMNGIRIGSIAFPTCLRAHEQTASA